MARFAQQTRLKARPGQSATLLEKFLEAAEIQRSNPACRLMLAGASVSQEDVVYLIEVWSSQDDWEKARESPAIAAWSRGMPELVAGPPQSFGLDPIGGKGI